MTNIYYSQEITKILSPTDRLRIGRQILNVLENYTEGNELKKMDCLDYGCSSGIVTEFLSKSFNSIKGIDIDKHAIDNAKKLYKKIEFKLVTSEKIPFPDNYFDVVICNQVYNFVDNPQEMVNEIYRVLKTGGICFFSARNKYALIEPQYNLPFLSWLPLHLGMYYLKLLNNSKRYFGSNYMPYWELKKLVSIFKIHDYTIKIIKDPNKFGFTKLQKFQVLSKKLPLNLLLPFIPNFIWILEK